PESGLDNMRRHLSTLLIAAGLLLMAWPVVTWAYGVYWQDRMARDWSHVARKETAPRVPDAATPEPQAPPLARLRIERIGLDAIVVEGINAVSLRRGPAHLSDTGMPGESRNCAIASHRDSWFRRLPELEPGDVAELDTPGCHYEYVVDERQVVAPD